jgi:hypothetical protein
MQNQRRNFVFLIESCVCSTEVIKIKRNLSVSSLIIYVDTWLIICTCCFSSEGLELCSWNASQVVNTGMVSCAISRSHWCHSWHFTFICRFSSLTRARQMTSSWEPIVWFGVRYTARVHWRQGLDFEAHCFWIWHSWKFSGTWDLRIVEKTLRILSTNFYPQFLFDVFLGVKPILEVVC